MNVIDAYAPSGDKRDEMDEEVYSALEYALEKILMSLDSYIAFDTFDHQLLLKTIQYYGLHNLSRCFLNFT